ncbi:hypothetical protein BH11ARM2_BH11ARM2_04330 [soil metagenome]
MIEKGPMLAFTAAMALLAGPSAGTGTFTSTTDSFVANQGQWDSRARFMARSRGANLWVTDDGYVIDFSRKENGRKVGNVVRVTLDGAGKSQPGGITELPGKVNYFIGKNTTTGVSRYTEVRTAGAAPGVDARYYFDAGRPRYDLVVRPRGDASAIHLNYEGVSNLRVGNDGNLRYDTVLGTVEERGLFAYQNVNGRQVQVPASVKVGKDGKVGFSLGTYDKSKAVVIDPVVWATYAGGLGNDSAAKIALDRDGNVVTVGTTDSAFFPTTTGAYDTTANGSTDVFISRYSNDGTTLQFATYFGGTGADSVAGLAVGGAGNIIFAGTTNSTDLPTKAGQIVAGYRGGNDGFVTTLASTGASLVTSSYIGGSGDDSVAGIAIDDANLFITGTTASTNFPIVQGSGGERTGIQRNKLAGNDAFFGKVNTGSGNLIFSTYLGSNGNDQGVDVQPTGGGKAAVLGNTDGTNLLQGFQAKPGFQKTSGGGTDAFLVGVTADGLSLDYRTYLGGSGADMATAITGDATGVVLVGNTASSNFPVANGLTSPYTGPSAFITKVNLDGAAYAYSSVFGAIRTGTGSAYANDVVLDNTGGPVFVGTTDSTTLPTSGSGATTKRVGGLDSYVIRLSATGDSRYYGSYLGGTGDDMGLSLAIDGSGHAFVSGATASSDFPTTSGVPQGAFGGAMDGTITDYFMPVTLTSFSVNTGIAAPYRLKFAFTFDGASYATTLVDFTSDTNAFDLPNNFSTLKGAKGANLSVDVKPLFNDVTYHVTATIGDGTAMVTGTLQAPNITAATFPATVVSGTTATGSVGLQSASTLKIPLALKVVDGAGNTVPASIAKLTDVTIPIGATSAPVKLITGALASDMTVYVEGAKGVKSAPILIQAIRPSSLGLSTPKITGPGIITGTVFLTGKAPVGGIVVSLSSDDASATFDSPTVTVPEGATKVTFNINVAAVAVTKTVTISGTEGGTTVSTSFQNKH